MYYIADDKPHAVAVQPDSHRAYPKQYSANDQ